jgi:glutamate racemase
MQRTTIGVFDSGFGGLTVLRALLPLIPDAHYIYLGDTARLPYGAKSQATIARYAVESARFLAARGADLLVIACNTATALALPEITAAAPIPVIGVVQPGAQAAAQALTLLSEPLALGPEPYVLVLATAATVASHAYRSACAELGLHATEKACPLLVPLVEEGWIDHPVTRDVLRIYLTEALATCNPQAIILGCTHYPLLASEIADTLRNLHSTALIIDSAHATAQAVAAALNMTSQPTSTTATFECFATDSVEKFQRLGNLFLHQPLIDVQLLDLGG